MTLPLGGTLGEVPAAVADAWRQGDSAIRTLQTLTALADAFALWDDAFLPWPLRVSAGSGWADSSVSEPVFLPEAEATIGLSPLLGSQRTISRSAASVLTALAVSVLVVAPNKTAGSEFAVREFADFGNFVMVFEELAGVLGTDSQAIVREALVLSLAMALATHESRGSPITLAEALRAADSGIDIRGAPGVSVDETTLATQETHEFRATRSVVQPVNLALDSLSQVAKTALEHLQAQAGLSAEQILHILEQVQLASQFATRGVQGRSLDDGLVWDESWRLALLALIEEDPSLAALGSPVADKAAALEALVRIGGATITQLKASEWLALSILLDDQARRFFERTTADTLAAGASLTAMFHGFAAVLEPLMFSETAAGSAAISVVSSASAALDGLPFAGGHFTAGAEDRLSLVTLGLKIGDETYIGWLLNTESTGVTQYQDYPFNSLARFGERYLGAGEMGVCELAGDTDAGAPIHARLKTGVTNFETAHRKRMHRAYLGMTAEGQVVLKVTIDTGKEDWYRLTPRSGPLHTERLKLGKGVKSAYWQFEVANVDGADFELESLELVPIVLSRRL